MSPVLGTSPQGLKKNPSSFDAIGAFNSSQNENNSLALPLDVGVSIPANQRLVFMDANAAKPNVVKGMNTPATAPKENLGFWGQVFDKMEKAYNFATQAIVFGMTISDKNSPANTGTGFAPEKINAAWDASREISLGQALAYKNVNSSVGDIVRTVGNRLTNNGVDKFIEDHMIYAANDFDLFDKKQRKKAFETQAIGRINSLTIDVIGRFYIDPTIIGGKVYKTYKAGAYAVKGTKDLQAIMAGEKAGRKASRVKATFEGFLEQTDNMNASDLFRVKAIRESANPATFADLLAAANKIDDKVYRHTVKADIVHMAMGDAGAAERLMNADRLLAAKVGALQDELVSAKYLGEGVDKATGQMTFDLVNNGKDFDKVNELVREFEGTIDELHKKLSAEAILNPNIVPSVDRISRVRQYFSSSDDVFGRGQSLADLRAGGKFTDIRAGAASYGVRVLTGFFYKRPKGWIDFTDNQSAQTVDNLLSRVRGLSENQSNFYLTKIQSLENKIASAKTVKNFDADILKKMQDEAKALKKDYETSLFTVQKRDELFAKYTSAADPAARAAAYDEIEKEVFDIVARQFGYSTKDVNSAYALFSSGRAKAHNLIRERAYTGAIDPKTGAPVGAKLKPILGSEDLAYIVPLPLNETQLVKQLPVIDIDTMYKALSRHTRAHRFEKFGKVYRGETATAVRNVSGDIVDGLDSLIKFEVLARIGYPVRNVSEGFMRILATVGPMALLNGMTQGSRNLIANKFSGGKLDDIFKWSDEVKLAAHRDELKALRNVSDDPAAIDAQIDELQKMIDGEIPVKDKYGLGLREVDGVRYEDALGATPEQAQAILDKFIANGAKIVDAHFGDTSRKLSNALETNGDFVVINGTDANWADSYLRVVNRQVRNSKLTQQFLEGKTVDDVEKWLLSDKEGRKVMRLLAMGRDARAIAEANADNIDNLFPSWVSPELKAIAAKRQITAKDIEKYLGTDAQRYPSVNAAQIGAANGSSPAVRAYSNFLENFYHYLGEVPETNLVRHPLFVDLYRKRMDAAIRQAIDTYPGDVLPPEYVRKLEASARQWARAEMRRTLYDTSERVDSAHMLKYIFPFFGAFADVAEKWGKILIDDPSVIRKLETVYDSPDRAGMVEERDGLTYINLPGEWTKRLGIDRPIAIPKASLNLIFQGGSWWNPGAGWFVQFAASKLIKAVPALEQTALIKEILPYGPDGTGFSDLVLQNAALRKALAVFNPNDRMRANLTVLIAAEENHKYDVGLRDTVPTAAEINTRVLKTLAMEVATRATLPFATNTRSPYQFYIDEYHKLRQENPETAAEEFYNKYGDEYYVFTTSLSKNNTGIQATVEAEKRSKQLADLIAVQPELGWFIVGDSNIGEFSPSVYANQRERAVAPGSTTKFRERQDPYAAIKETNAEKGWIQYNKGMDFIESQRIARGLKSLQSKGAEDLKAARDEFIAGLSAENPDWAEVRGKIDTNKVNNFLKFATKLVEDDRLKDRPDIQAMRDYLVGREYIRKMLANRKSQSLDNIENADIKEAWDAFTGQLIDEKPAFNRIFTRMLENDDLRKGL